MSLGIAIKAPEGIVLAAESRTTLMAQTSPEAPVLQASFDNATKVLSFSVPNEGVGAVTYGAGAIGIRTASSFTAEFESTLGSQRLSVEEFAAKLSSFFLGQWQSAMPADLAGPGMTFVVGGFNQGEPYGRVFLLDIPNAPSPVEQHAAPGQFGIVWGGQREFVDRLVQGYDDQVVSIARQSLGFDDAKEQEFRQALQANVQMQLPFGAFGLQDCVDLALLFIKTTIEVQRLTLGIRGCGGPVDIATITSRDGFQFIQRKTVRGEHATTR